MLSDAISDLLGDVPHGISKAQLFEELRRIRPGIQPIQVEREIKKLIDRGSVELVGDLVRAASALVSAEEVIGSSAPSERPLRAVAFDVESVVRLTSVAPEFREARIFQLGGVRFGRDKTWCHAQRSFNSFLDLPGDGWEIRSSTARAQWERERRLAEGALEEFREFVADADLLVAYNGTGVDFPLLDEALARAELPVLDQIRYVDGYYLALALWPTPPRQHRLKELAERVGAKASRLHWHDAVDDSMLLAQLLTLGARKIRSFDRELCEMLRSATVDSDAWDLLFSLAGLDPASRAWPDDEIASVLSSAFVTTPLRRVDTTEDDHAPAKVAREMVLPSSLSVNGKVSPLALAIAAGRNGEPRPAQLAMKESLSIWIDEGKSGLVEAPTGTGKSYAMLASALEWLDADRSNKVVIATFTKQLQSQLADDIQALAQVIPGLDDVSDLVKGKGNRMSMRALVTALSDVTVAASQPRRGRQAAFARDIKFRELLAYLALRPMAPASLSEGWEVRSVDGPDIPAFFTDYCGGRLYAYLASLSQAAAGEYGPRSGPLALFTDDVAEAISNHRLIVANHALLLSNLDDLVATSETTLLMIDEAHMLEDAATNSMTFDVDSDEFEQLPNDVWRMLPDFRGSVGIGALNDAATDLERLLDTERIPRMAMECFDDESGDVGSRSVSLASPRTGAVSFIRAAHFLGALRELRGALGRMRFALSAMEASGDVARASRFSAERFWALATRVAATHDSLTAVISDAAALLGPSHTASTEMTTAEAEDGESAVDGELTEIEEVGAEADADASTLAPADAAEVEPADDDHDEGTRDGASQENVESAPNRIIWIQETGLSDISRSIRSYRFRVASSPIALPAEPAWADFLGLVPRTYFISATLTVAGRWEYIRSRLGLDETQVPALALESPFDLGRQAKLVCFEDFPSWTEQPTQAVRSVSWQLSRYANEAVVGHREEAATWDNGAMVLTTSRRSAAEISLGLQEMLAASGNETPVHVASLLGTARATENFRTVGGMLVGTRGLWQGVDINNPDRLKMVWINKLPFAPYADPIIAARRALAAEVAERRGEEDPEQAANEEYYLPLAAISLRQAVGRLIRSNDHYGVVVISDKKLSGPTRLRQSYRRIFLGSLDPSLLEHGGPVGDVGVANVATMSDGWTRIWRFLGERGVLTAARVEELCTTDALLTHTLLPETKEILGLALTRDDEAELRSRGEEVLREEVLRRSEKIGALLSGRPDFALRPEQREAIAAAADGRDLLAILPTGFGKSFVFQLPALVLPGVTIVISPLVSLMHNQTLGLNRSIGGAVRALVASLTESNSRLGKAEVADALTGRGSHGIRIVYMSPERLASRQFQDIVRRGVESGIIRRIAIDEAHTAVQWGDDFRPAFRRAERFLSTLREAQPGLAISALTATANQAVREGLRTGVFGLTAEVSEHEPGFAFVTANPLRPELAIYRRVLGAQQGGRVTVAGLVELVAEKLNDHAIFYCLTVREVDALWAQLREFVGAESAGRVRRYHGRLPEAEKAAVVADFVDAPRKGDEDFAPMIVVATSAFGLGIDRPDIRCVFVVSPPTDLAALYQQLGRAGRDSTVAGIDPDGPYNVGLALGTGSGFNLVRYMTSQDLREDLFVQIAQSILALGTNPAIDEMITLDAENLAIDMIATDFRDDKITEKQLRSERVHDQYKTAVIRVVAALSMMGAIDDLGDFPNRLKIMAGEVASEDPMTIKIVDSVLSLGVRPLRRIDVVGLHAHLIASIDEYRDLAEEPGATWAMLADLHALGFLDISQVASTAQPTGLVLKAAPDSALRTLPSGFVDRLRARMHRSQVELVRLKQWYEDAGCANEGLADYFQVPEIPEGTCAHGISRCSSCWDTPRVAESGNPLPELLRAFRTPRPRPSSALQSGRPAFERNLEIHIDSLLWGSRRGLGAPLLMKVLRGADTYFDRRTQRPRPLWPELLYSRHRGSAPGVNQRDVDSALERMNARGEVVAVGEFWRHRSHVETDERRAQRDQGANAT